MIKPLLCFFFVLVVQLTPAQHLNLSSEAEISVLTIGPGTSLNDAFGHNAFRIQDPVNYLDITFDYGRYDFNAPNFYLNFAQGKLNYAIGKEHYNAFISYYISTNRDIKEQVLNLSQSEKQVLFDYLVTNNNPENKDYLYDFFYDNCATKIKDVVNKTLDNQVIYNIPEKFQPKTFRELIHDNVPLNSWGSLGIDIALGSVIDIQATPEEHMFLPKYIHLFFSTATMPENKALVKDSIMVYSEKPLSKSSSFLSSPLCILGLLAIFILYITYKDTKNNTRSKWLDVGLFSLTGLVGVGILLLWFATNHTATHQNYNLLWAFPLNLLMVDVVLRKRTKRWFIAYLKFLLIMLCLLTLHWLIGVQVFAIGLIPLLIALFIRYLFLVRHFLVKIKTETT